MRPSNRGVPRPTPGSLLAARRAGLGLTLAQVGERAGLPLTTVGHYERGRCRRPDEEKFGRYAAALGLGADEALRMIPQWPITPWGGNPFARRGRYRVQLPHALCRRAHRLCREWDRNLDDLVADALARELDRIEGLPGEE